jgi:putative ABC transport system substrate-binding protein
MRRRDFITLSGAAVVAGTLDVRAQQSPRPVIGFLRVTSATNATNLVAAFRQGLNDAGFFDGQNIAVEYRWADGHEDRLPALATDLINRQVAVIIGHSTAAVAAKAITTTVPIVAVVGDDPVHTGLVANLNRPGGNVTGVTFTTIEVSGKRLSLLSELVPHANVLAALVDPTNLIASTFDREVRVIEDAAKTLDRRLLMIRVGKTQDLEPAFTDIVKSGAGALHVGSGPFFTSQRQRLVLLSARHAIPSSYSDREYVSAGGLLSYGPSQVEAYRRAAIYAARIVRGEKPGDLPFELPRKYELVINIGTAKVLGLKVPNSMQLLADEVIE